MTDNLILTVYVRCGETAFVKGHTRDIAMIHFTGTAEGCFSGSVIADGTDTQKISKDGVCLLSARYMLEGTDSAGKKCRLFIENETGKDGRLHPSVVTDSEALAELETAALYSVVEPSDGGVTVSIYKET